MNRTGSMVCTLLNAGRAEGNLTSCMTAVEADNDYAVISDEKRMNGRGGEGENIFSLRESEMI